MSVWARNEQRRLVRIVSPRNSEKSIISQVLQDNILPQMDHYGISNMYLMNILKGFLLTHKDSMNLHNMEVMLHYQ